MRREERARHHVVSVLWSSRSHALACLRYLNNNPAYAWACINAKSLVDLYEKCGETIENDPHVLAKLVGDDELG
mgnify:CR=1 FL=1